MHIRTKATILDEARRASRGIGIRRPGKKPTSGEAAYLRVFDGGATGLGDAGPAELGGMMEDVGAMISHPVSLIRADLARVETALKTSTIASIAAAVCALAMVAGLGGSRRR